MQFKAFGLVQAFDLLVHNNCSEWFNCVSQYGKHQKENNKYNKYNAIQRVFTAEQQLYLLYLLSSFYQ